jgi:quercetin dioxygenase-like cupin family protein
MPPPRPGAEDALATQSHGDPRFDAKRPGFHRTDTLDFVQILEGRIALELHDEERVLGPGDCVVQRGTWHRWRVLGDRPCLYQVAMCRPAPGAHPPSGTRVPHGPGAAGGTGPRRVVTDVADGRSVFASDGPPARAFALEGSGLAFADLWQTGGALRDALQGGDLEARAWAIEPAGRGISWRMLTLPPERTLARVDAAATARELAEKAPGFGHDGHHHAARPGLHRTDTLDLILVLDGELDLELPGLAPRRLRRGDAVVQRGTWHLWHNRGDAPCKFSAVMLAAPPFPAGRIAQP